MENKWKIQIAKFENDHDFNAAVELVHQTSDNSFEKVELYTRTMFMGLDFLVEETYSDDEYNFYSENLKLLFNESFEKFCGNAEYLAFTGMMITRAEWYFNKSFDDGLGMMKKAQDAEPENIFYKSLYWVFEDQRLDVNTNLKFTLLNQFFASPTNQQWLESKGLLGMYIVGIFESVYKKTAKGNL